MADTLNDLKEIFSSITQQNVDFLLNRYNKINRWVISDILKRSAYHYPNKIALRFKDISLTYSELDKKCNKMANALIDLGVKKYDRVAILAHNTLHHVITMFGCYKMGAIYLAINYLLHGPDIKYCIDHSESKVFIVEDSLYPLVKDVIDDMKTVKTFIWSDEGEGEKAKDSKFIDFNELYEAYDDAEPDVVLRIEDPCQMTYTSGTESKPKGVILTHQSLLSQYVGCIVDGAYSPEDVNLNALPIYHCAQRDVFLTPMLWLGGENILINPVLSEILRNIEKYNVTMFFAPPTVWIGMLRHPNFKKYNLKSLKKLYYGASIMPVEILKELLEKFPGAKIYNYYGQTELAPYHTILKAEDALRKLGSAGKGGLNMETRLEDDSGNTIDKPGVVGEITGRGPHVMLMYFKNPEATEKAVKGGWFHSGDLGVMDEEGYITVVDRKKDMIKTGGENVSSREVEEAIYLDERVKEVAVIGVPHPKWIEAVCAVVIPKEGENLTENDIIEHCKKHLSPFKVPKKAIIVDSIPKTPTGKILKRELRERFKHLFKEKTGAF